MTTCIQCAGTGQRATAKTANGRDLERHEKHGTRCDGCGGTGIEPAKDAK